MDSGIFISFFILLFSPYLSNQTFDIILITKAEHLDSNRSVISDIYDSVKALDGNWSEEIPDGDYVRVTFKIPLDSSRDFTLYPRATNGTPRIEVYEVDGNEVIATFENLADNEYNKVYLIALNGTQDVFDLRVIDGSIEIEHIIDPTYTYNYSTGRLTAYDMGGGIPTNPFNSSLTAANSSNYAAINLSDNVRWLTAKATVANDFDSQVFIFNLTGEISNGSLATALNFTWEGYGSNVSGYATNISFWNWTSGAWFWVANYSFTASTDNTTYNAITSGIGDFINSTTKQVAALVATKDKVTYSLAYTENSNVQACSGDWYNAFGGSSCPSTYDGSWTTYGQGGRGSGGARKTGTGVVLLNYTMPANAVNSGTLWQVKDGWAIVNLTIPSGCWSSVRLAFRATSTYDTGTAPTTDKTDWACYNYTSSAFVNLRSTSYSVGYGDVYEEGIYWNSSSNTPLYTDFVSLQIITTEDIVNPLINFTSPTPSNNSVQVGTSIYVNVSSSDQSDHYTFVDFDRSNVLWMRMDDVNASGDPTDISSWSNNGSKKGNAVQTSAGYFGKGFGFDGAGDYIDFPDSQQTICDGCNFTISAWIYPISAQSILVDIFSMSDSTTWANRAYGIATSTSPAIYAFVGNSSTQVSDFCSNYVQNSWNYYVAVFNGTHIHCYSNGVSSGSPTSISTLTGTVPKKFISSSEVIGAGYEGVLGYFNGTIDEVLIFNRSLSSSEIQSLYNASAYKYYNNFTGLSAGQHNFTGYAVDKSGNRNQTEARQVTIDTTTCTYTSGNWNINCWDNCTITSNVNLGGNNITFTGVGSFNVQVNITNIKKWEISTNCKLMICTRCVFG